MIKLSPPTNVLVSFHGSDYILFAGENTLAHVPKGSSIVSILNRGPVTAIDEFGRDCLGEKFSAENIEWKDVIRHSLAEKWPPYYREF